MKPKQIYRISSKDENEKSCFIGATIDFYQTRERLLSFMNQASAVLSSKSIFEYIRLNGGADMWHIELIEKNEKGNHINQLRRYNVGEYENMENESLDSIMREKQRKYYYSDEYYNCVCGTEIKYKSIASHSMSQKHRDFITILEHNKKFKFYCECGLWIEKSRVKSHTKSVTHRKRMDKLGQIHE